MKVACIFLACVIGYAAAMTCNQVGDCDATITMCGTGYTLACEQGNCVCTGGTGTNPHQCQTADDCHNANLHHCKQGHHWACENNHCHCVAAGGK